MRYKTYLKPFDETGMYVSDYVEITNDVISVSDIQQKLDGSEFDIGVFKNSGVNILIRNDLGKYGPANSLQSVFKTKRKNSMLKITWEPEDYDIHCGFITCGETVLSEEVVLFEGLLNEVSSLVDIDKQTVSFSVLGFESVLNEMETPFEDLSNGELASSVIYKILNQEPFNNFVNVDALNIDLGFDFTIDDITDLELKTVNENLKQLLLLTNSVLYINNNIAYVTAREPSLDLKYSFYGQGSNIGAENIINIPIYREGLNRTFNYWVWSDTDILSQDITSVATYGVLKKELSSNLVTNSTKKQNILNTNRDEFRTPKPELELITPISNDVLRLNLLDKVSIDYPTIYTPSDNNPLPRYGAVVYGSSRYPFGQFSLTIDSERRFKILGKKINKSKDTITFSLREI